MTDKEKQELFENICNDISCGTYTLAPQYVDKLLAKLEKENAELKEINTHTLSQLNLDNGELITKLTKAKEIIREFVEWATWQGNSKCPSFKSIQDKAEQFLNEVEK